MEDEDCDGDGVDDGVVVVAAMVVLLFYLLSLSLALSLFDAISSLCGI